MKIDLENSKILSERKEYLEFLKLVIKNSEEIIKSETKYLNSLKDKLNQYDLFQQKSVYKCSICQELQDNCVCGEIKNEIELEIKPEELNKLF